MTTLTISMDQDGRAATSEAQSNIRGRRAAIAVAALLAAFLPLNTYWALGGTWGLAWVLGCAGCTVPLPVVSVQEAMIGAGIVVVLARSGVWRVPLPGWVARSGTWTMTVAFAAVGAQNLIGDNTLQARFLFAPTALGLSALCAIVGHRFGRVERRGASATRCRVAPPAPQWARRAAVLAVLVVVPSGLWRVAMAIGIPVGASEEILRDHYAFASWGTVYVFGLTIVQIGLAMLTLGLVQRWGEVVPRWIPFVGGKDVPPMAAVVPAAAGAVALTLLWTSVMSSVGGIWTLYGLDGFERVVMMACYLPMLAWGPLLAAVTASYHLRHRGIRSAPAAHPGE